MGLAAGASLGPLPLRAFAAEPNLGAQSAAPGFLFNQLGFLPPANKTATLRGADPTSNSFRVLSTTAAQPTFEGHLGAPQVDALSGDTVQQSVFTAVKAPGTYILQAGTLKSEPFRIGPDVYAGALRTTVRGYTGQRCGCKVDLGDGYQHPACHLDGAYGATSGKSGKLPNAGGWHDAADYGRYVVNSGITCGTLLWAWELYPDALRSLDLDLARMGPKKNNKLPDYLDEVLWNLNWMLEMQDTDGGVFHKQTSEHFCAFIMPQDDHLVSEVIGTGQAPYKSTCATADLAAVMAIAARCYAEFDAPLAARFRTAAEKAWTWAMAHPNVTFENPPGILTGGYGDPHCGDELAWASAELWRTTTDPRYEKAFIANLPGGRGALRIGAPSWGNVGSLACWTYALAKAEGDASLKADIQARTKVQAQRLIAQGKINGYGNTMVVADYGWGSNSEAGNQALLLLLAHHFEANADAVAAAMANLDYLVGRNCFGVSWITGVGTRPFQHPHHRPSAADGIPAPWPGLLSGGPNRHPGDPAARTLPNLPPMRMWLDDEKAYSLNEIAINWNAPLVFTLAAVNSLAMS